MTPRARELESVLVVQDPVDSLRSVIGEKLDRDGFTREAVLGDLEDLRQALDEDGLLTDEEAVMTVMDQLVGWCNPAWSLVNRGVSELDDDFVPLEEIASPGTGSQVEHLAAAWDDLDNLDIAGTDEDGLPLYLIEGRIVTLADAQAYLVEQGLADPEVLTE